MGKRGKQRDAQSLQHQMERALSNGDTREAVEAAKLLLREQPGEASQAFAVRAYIASIRALIDEGLGREAAATASLARERFPAHVGAHASLFEDARLAGSDFDWLLGELRSSGDERRAAIEERLMPWITDPGAIARSTVLDPSDALAREARIVAEAFEIVTSRTAAPEELAPLGDIRRRSPFAPWKLLVRAIAAFHANDDERVIANVGAIDARSPAARAGRILSEIVTGVRPANRSFAAERLIDRISGGQATIALQIRNIEAAFRDDDRRRLREELRALSRSFDKLSPYALEQVRLALLPICGSYFGPEQLAGPFRLEENSPDLERYGALLMESAGLPAAAIWTAYTESLLDRHRIEPWQAAEIYLHVLSRDENDDDDPFVCRDPTHGHPVDEMPDTANVIDKIIRLQAGPSVFSRMAPYLDRLERNDLRRVLVLWRNADPDASEPLVRLLRLSEKARSYDEGLELIREVESKKIIDPEFARLRLALSFRRAEELLSRRKPGAAEKLLGEVAPHVDESGDAAIYLLALQWAAAPPAIAADLLTRLAQHGVTGELVLAEVTGELGLPFALPASHPSPAEFLEGVRRGISLLHAVGKPARHSSWLIERAVLYFDQANEAQLLAIGSIARLNQQTALGWKATERGLAIGGPLLHRMLLLRAELLVDMRVDMDRCLDAIVAASALAQQANDGEAAARASELLHRYPYAHLEKLSNEEIAVVVDRERASPMPQARVIKPRKKAAPKPKSSRKKTRDTKKDGGLFD